MQRTLSEAEFNAVRDKVLASLPSGLSEGDYNRTIGPAMAQAIGEAENMPASPQGSAAGRFVSGAASMLNPIPAAKAIGNAIAHPVDTAEQIGGAMGAQADKAKQAYQEGRYPEMVGHGLAAAIPVLGPAAANTGEKIASGDVAGGLGEAAGMLTPALAADAIRVGGKAAGILPKSSREIVAERLSQVANQKIEDVMAPKVGANKVRFGNMAEDVAPKLSERGDINALSREGLHGNVQAKLVGAEQALDAAADSRLNAKTFPTQPIIQDLLAKRAKLTAQAVEGSAIDRGATVTGKSTGTAFDIGAAPQTKPTAGSGGPIGADVVPGPNAARVAEIDKAIAEIKQLGPVARYEPLRVIRQAYDGPAKAVYSPAVTADYMKAQGGKLGAADVTGTLRDALAKFDPETAKANADYSLYRSANDVLEATREIERVRPTVGRQIASRLGGAAVGGEAGGMTGAAAGFILGPTVDAATRAGFTTKLQTARLLSTLADAVRKGDIGAVTSLNYRLKQLAGQAAVVQGATSPSAPQTSTGAMPSPAFPR